MKPPAAAATSDEPHPATWRIWGVEFDSRIVQLTGLSTLLLTISFSGFSIGSFTPSLEYARFILELVVPLALVVLIWREDPRRYGWRLGDWRLGLPVTVVMMAVMAAVIWVVGRWPDFALYYEVKSEGRSALQLVLDMGIDLLGWEFFFRGWLLWGLGRKYGSDAIWLQMVPFALMHVFKPQVEVVSTVVGGVFFGILAWRTRSFLYGWLLHWFMVVWVVVVAAGWV